MVTVNESRFSKSEGETFDYCYVCKSGCTFDVVSYGRTVSAGLKKIDKLSFRYGQCFQCEEIRRLSGNPALNPVRDPDNQDEYIMSPQFSLQYEEELNGQIQYPRAISTLIGIQNLTYNLDVQVYATSKLRFFEFASYFIYICSLGYLFANYGDKLFELGTQKELITNMILPLGAALIPLPILILLFREHRRFRFRFIRRLLNFVRELQFPDEDVVAAIHILKRQGHPALSSAYILKLEQLLLGVQAQELNKMHE